MVVVVLALLRLEVVDWCCEDDSLDRDEDEENFLLDFFASAIV